MVRCDASTMPKIQKTLPLNDQLCELIQEYADANGTSFSKVVTAAVLEFFLYPATVVRPPHPEWLSFASALDADKVKLSDVQLHRYQEYMTHIENNIAVRKDLSEMDKRSMLDNLKALRHRTEQWKDLLEEMGGGQAGLIELLVRYLPRLVTATIPLQQSPAADGG